MEQGKAKPRKKENKTTKMICHARIYVPQHVLGWLVSLCSVSSLEKKIVAFFFLAGVALVLYYVSSNSRGVEEAGTPLSKRSQRKPIFRSS